MAVPIEEKFATLIDQLITINDYTNPKQSVFKFIIPEYPLNHFTLKCRTYTTDLRTTSNSYNLYIDGPLPELMKLKVKEELIDAQTLDRVTTNGPVEQTINKVNEAKWSFSYVGNPMIYRTLNKCDKAIVTAWLKIEVSVPKEMELPEIPSSNVNVLTNFSKFFNDLTFGDIQVLVEEETFYVSKLVLSANSPVFAANMQTKMIESVNNKIKIADFKTEIIEQMLKFMYDNETELYIDLIRELFVAADKYKIKHLKSRCVLMMLRNINAETAAPYLITADQYNLSTLRQSCVNFLCANYKEFSETKDCDEFFKTFTKLAIELSVTATQL